MDQASRVALGGTHNGTIIHWPRGIKAKGERRHQFHHVIDVAPTILEVAATLAAALVGYDTLNAAGRRLLDRHALNAVFVLMLTTSILGPVLTERFARRIEEAARAPKADGRQIVVRLKRHDGALRFLTTRLSDDTDS
jgi:hypothetical protein